jgi:hypothetical protein
MRLLPCLPAGDSFAITLDGVTVFRESFANATLDGFGGPRSSYTDSAYDFGQDPRFQGLPHDATNRR